MGKEIREELKIIPAGAAIVRHVQHVYAWRNCETASAHVPILKATAALPNTLLGKTIHYARYQRRYFERYLLDGRLEISNNRAERSIKPMVPQFGAAWDRLVYWPGCSFL